MSNQYKSSEKQFSLLEEVFQEVDSSCNNLNCDCQRCSLHKKWNNGNIVRQQIQELGWELNGEEEYELSKAFDKIKHLARKGYNKARPWIATAKILTRLISPSYDPNQKINDQAAFIQKSKEEQMQNGINNALPAKKRNFKQKPESETSMMSEIFMEVENNFDQYINFLNKELGVQNYEDHDDLPEHTNNARPSTRDDHTKGMSRKDIDKNKKEGGRRGGGDRKRGDSVKRPDGWKGPWPTKQGIARREKGRRG